MHNLYYTLTTLGVQSWREIISGGTRTKKVEYHCINVCFSRYYSVRLCRIAFLYISTLLRAYTLVITASLLSYFEFTYVRKNFKLGISGQVFFYSNLIIEALHSSETSEYYRTTQCYNPEDVIVVRTSDPTLFLTTARWYFNSLYAAEQRNAESQLVQDVLSGLACGLLMRRIVAKVER
jgi:hypothetical protein